MNRTVQFLLLFSFLSMAAIWDIKKRIVPDCICIPIVVIGLVPLEPMRILGMLAALPLLIAGMTIGGIGGGDIKLTGAVGLVLGFYRTITGLLLALLLLILFHGCRSMVQIVRQKIGRKRGTCNKDYCIRKDAIRKCDSIQNESRNTDQNREQAYPLVPFLFLGMLVSVLC